MLKNPWETPEGKVIWKTEAMYWSWLRGAMRRMWSDYPLRKEWKKRQLRPLTKEEKESKLYHPSTKNVGQCSYCNEWMAGSKLECDHKVESEGCTSKETAESFLWHCGGLTGDDFRLACKPCHKTRSYQQRVGGSFEEAHIAKQAIAIQKVKGGDVKWLIARAVPPGKNAKIRKQQIIDKLKLEKFNLEKLEEEMNNA